MLDFTPFLLLWQVIYEFTFLNIKRLYDRKWQCYHYLGIIFLIEKMVSDSNYMVITILNFFKLSFEKVLPGGTSFEIRSNFIRSGFLFADTRFTRISYRIELFMFIVFFFFAVFPVFIVIIFFLCFRRNFSRPVQSVLPENCVWRTCPFL